MRVIPRGGRSFFRTFLFIAERSCYHTLLPLPDSCERRGLPGSPCGPGELTASTGWAGLSGDHRLTSKVGQPVSSSITGARPPPSTREGLRPRCPVERRNDFARRRPRDNARYAVSLARPGGSCFESRACFTRILPTWCPVLVLQSPCGGRLGVPSAFRLGQNRPLSPSSLPTLHMPARELTFSPGSPAWKNSRSRGSRPQPARSGVSAVNSSVPVQA